MRKLCLLLACAPLFAVPCDDKIASLQSQIMRSELANKPNQIKISYLQERLDGLEKHCKDGQIHPSMLREIDFKAKINYERARIEQDKAKLRADYERLAEQKAKLDARAKALKERIDKISIYD